MLTKVNKGILVRLFPKGLFSLFIAVKFSSSSCYCAIVIASLHHRHGTATPLCHRHRIMSSSLHRPRPRSILRWFDSELHSTIQIQYSNPIFNLAPHMRLWAPKECQILNATCILLFQLKFELVYNNARKKDVFSSFRVNIFPYGTRVIF